MLQGLGDAGDEGVSLSGWFERVADKAKSAVDVPAPKLERGWCGVLQKDGAVFWDSKSDSDACILVKKWFPKSKAAYNTDISKDHLVHVLFETEVDLLEAMRMPMPNKLGFLRRCHGSAFNCGHRDGEIKELVVLELNWSRQSLRGPIDTPAERKNMARAVTKFVGALPGQPVVDDAWIKVSKSFVGVFLAMHLPEDVDKLIKMEDQLGGAGVNASKATLSVLNSPALQRCLHCKERGHSGSDLCPTVHGGRFAIKAIFQTPVSEIGRQKIEEMHRQWGPFHSIFTGNKVGVKQPRRCMYVTYTDEKELKLSCENFLTTFHGTAECSLVIGAGRIHACEECGIVGHALRECPIANPRIEKFENHRQFSYSAAVSKAATAAPVRSTARPAIGQPGYRRPRWGECYQFVSTGDCSFVQCKFRHPADIRVPEDHLVAQNAGRAVPAQRVHQIVPALLPGVQRGSGSPAPQTPSSTARPAGVQSAPVSPIPHSPKPVLRAPKAGAEAYEDKKDGKDAKPDGLFPANTKPNSERKIPFVSDAESSVQASAKSAEKNVNRPPVPATVPALQQLPTTPVSISPVAAAVSAAPSGAISPSPASSASASSGAAPSLPEASSLQDQQLQPDSSAAMTEALDELSQEHREPELAAATARPKSGVSHSPPSVSNRTKEKERLKALSKTGAKDLLAGKLTVVTRSHGRS